MNEREFNTIQIQKSSPSTLFSRGIIAGAISGFFGAGLGLTITHYTLLDQDVSLTKIFNETQSIDWSGIKNTFLIGGLLGLFVCAIFGAIIGMLDGHYNNNNKYFSPNIFYSVILGGILGIFGGGIAGSLFILGIFLYPQSTKPWLQSIMGIPYWRKRSPPIESAIQGLHKVPAKTLPAS